MLNEHMHSKRRSLWRCVCVTAVREEPITDAAKTVAALALQERECAARPREMDCLDVGADDQKSGN
jgi:hypothetical protein